MTLNIGNRLFDSDEINYLTIRDTEVFLDYKDDFVRISYTSKEEIRDALLYKKLQELTYQDIYEAIQILITVCTYFINSKEQCVHCPLHKKKCILTTLPINWKN